MLAQRCKQSQSTRKRNGEAFPEGNTANYLIVQIYCGFSGGWCGKYSTSAANKPVHNVEARPCASHCFPHKHVLLFWQTRLIRFHLLLLNSVSTFTVFEVLAISSILLWRYILKKNQNQKLCDWSKASCMSNKWQVCHLTLKDLKRASESQNACENPQFLISFHQRTVRAQG